MKKILIVDDDYMTCVLAKHALSDGYHVNISNSGKDALAYLETELPDLILLDIEMPDMDGKEVIKRIKACDSWAKIPIAFLTADSNPMTEAECLQCGADDFITKPFVPVVVKSRVDKILEAHELRRDLEMQLEDKTKKSLTDVLTGLNNREYLQKKMQELLDNGHVGTLFMIDLDNFKTINDTYGHIVGDKILQYFSGVLINHARKGDIVCRLAGDEFVLFYTDLTDRDVIAERAEGIIRSFAEKTGALGYAGIVSVSIGIRITTGKESFQEIYGKADKSLYFVKNNGKNAYYFYDDNTVDADETLNEISTTADLECIRRLLAEGLDASKGAFHVAYDEFKKIYDFVLRCVARKQQKVQIVLFTINILNSGDSVISVEMVMESLKKSIISSLRAVDTGTQYSSSQYMVILLDADKEDGKGVAERVIKNFYDNSGVASETEILYDIQTI